MSRMRQFRLLRGRVAKPPNKDTASSNSPNAINFYDESWDFMTHFYRVK